MDTLQKSLFIKDGLYQSDHVFTYFIICVCGYVLDV